MQYALIDGNALAFAAQSVFMSKKGGYKRLYSGDQETSAVSGMLMYLREIQMKFPGAKLMVIWDHGKAWRYDIYPEYKGNRKDNPDLLAVKEALVSQRPVVRDLLDKMGIPQMHADRYEADDVAAALSKRMAISGHEVILVTRDHDWLQMVDERISWYSPIDLKHVNHLLFLMEIGKTPDQFSESKILEGDKGDNVMGIKGVGKVGVDSIISIFGTAEAWMNGWDDWVREGGLEGKHPLNRQRVPIQKFLADREAAEAHIALNRQLVDLRPMFNNQEVLQKVVRSPGRFDEKGLIQLLKQLAFLRIVAQFETWIRPFKK